MRTLLTIALAGLLFTITGCAKTTSDAAAADEAPAAEAAPAAEEAAPAAEEAAPAADETAHADGAACSCGKGKAGESAWCDSCGVGYVDGAKVACKGCYDAKTGGTACGGCDNKAAE